MGCLRHGIVSYLWIVTGWSVGGGGWLVEGWSGNHCNFTVFSSSFVKRYKEVLSYLNSSAGSACMFTSTLCRICQC